MIPRYHPGWLPSGNPLGANSYPTLDHGERAIGFPSNAGNAAQTTKSDKPDYSPEQLGRELRSVSAGPGFQSEPRIPWQLSLAYFPPSSLFDLRDVFLLSLKLRDCQDDTLDSPAWTASNSWVRGYSA